MKRKWKRVGEMDIRLDGRKLGYKRGGQRVKEENKSGGRTENWEEGFKEKKKRGTPFGESRNIKESPVLDETVAVIPETPPYT